MEDTETNTLANIFNYDACYLAGTSTAHLHHTSFVDGATPAKELQHTCKEDGQAWAKGQWPHRHAKPYNNDYSAMLVTIKYYCAIRL